VSRQAGSRAVAIVVTPGGISPFPAGTEVAAGLQTASRAVTGAAGAPVTYVTCPLLIALES